jgi:hypothetical protein
VDRDGTQVVTEPKYRLKGGVKPYVLTHEDRLKGSRKAAELRREAAKSALVRARELVEQRAELLIRPYLDAMAKGDWRAAEALMTRVYGSPTQRVETADVTDVHQLPAGELAARAREILARFEAGEAPSGAGEAPSGA